jgi:hypothetical protein
MKNIYQIKNLITFQVVEDTSFFDKYYCKDRNWNDFSLIVATTVYQSFRCKTQIKKTMTTIKEKMLTAFYEQAINNLIEKKNQLDKDFLNGLINYAEYEEHKWIISNEIESLKS